MHFTLWPGLTSNTGAHAEIAWPNFLAFVAAPTIAPTKDSLEGWSPARFRDNRRGLEYVEAVSCLVLDDDKSGLSTKAVFDVWEPFGGVIHTSFSHAAETPRHRIVLRLSRDVTADEYARVWAHMTGLAAEWGQPLDPTTKDASRFWYVPGRREGSPYEWIELTGVPIDVDVVLSAEDSNGPQSNDRARVAPSPVGTHDVVERPAVATSRRAAMAAALGAAWPAKGRHAAQLALAGALRAEGFAEAEAVDFLCAVCRAAGDEDRPKREATCRHTYALPPGAPMTAWTRLKAHVDGVVVDAARGALGQDAEWSERLERRLAEVAANAAPKAATALAMPAPANVLQVGNFAFEYGGLDAELPPISWQVDSLIARGDVVLFVAHGNSLKTWLAFSIGAAIASGRPWLGRYITSRGRVALIDFESGRYEVIRRLKLLGARDDDVGDRLLRASFPTARLIEPETWISLAEARLEAVLVDSFNAASPDVDENDARAALMLQHAGRFAEATSCSVYFVHHARKGTGGDRREVVRGSTAIYAAVDRGFEFTDLEKRDGGVVLSTLRSIKDGAGRSPPPVRVELSDQGLRYVDAPAETPDGADADESKIDNRKLIVEILSQHSAGLQKAVLLDLLKGRNELRREAVAAMLAAGVIVTYRSEKCVWVMLRPGQ